MKCKECGSILKQRHFSKNSKICDGCKWANKLYANHDPTKGNFIDQFMSALTKACDKETLGTIIKNL